MKIKGFFSIAAGVVLAATCLGQQALVAQGLDDPGVKHAEKEISKHVTPRHHHRKHRKGAANSSGSATTRSTSGLRTGTSGTGMNTSATSTHPTTSGTKPTSTTGTSTAGGSGAGTSNGSGNTTHQTNNNASDNNQNNSNTSTQSNHSGTNIFAGLVNVNVSNINLQMYKLVDIHNVLDNSQVETLTQKITNSPGASANQQVLNNLLRGAHILNGNQIVVGLMSRMHQIYYTAKK